MSDRFNTATTEKTTNEWLTPPSIIAALGEFDLDPCAPRAAVRPWNTAYRHFTGTRQLFDVHGDDEMVCGLATPWGGGSCMAQPSVWRRNLRLDSKTSSTSARRRADIRPHRDAGFSRSSLEKGTFALLLRGADLFLSRGRFARRHRERAELPCQLFGRRHSRNYRSRGQR